MNWTPPNKRPVKLKDSLKELEVCKFIDVCKYIRLYSLFIYTEKTLFWSTEYLSQGVLFLPEINLIDLTTVTRLFCCG